MMVGAGVLWILFMAFFSSTLATECDSRNASHNYFFGKRNFDDRMVFMSNPRHDGSYMKKHHTDVFYPLPGHRTDGVISYLEVVDQYDNGRGGCAFLVQGGVGRDFFVMTIKSNYRGGGYNFVVKAFVPRPPNNKVNKA